MDSVATMPTTLDIDWDHAHQLYNQGMKMPQIAKLLGAKPNTISAHAKRHGWAQRRMKATQAVAEVVQSIVINHPKTVQQRAERWVEREINRVEKITDVLDCVPIPTNITALREHVEVSAMNGKYGRSTFGLDQAGTNVQINIGRFGKASIEPIQDQPETIDIPPSD